MELVKINPQEFGLTDETAKNIQSQFQPMLEKMVELETEFNHVLSLPVEETQTSKIAKELRLKYVKVRTATAEIHKSQKAFYLNGGRFVDGWKNAQLFASQGKEEKLEKIEKHFENLERERKENLHNERVNLIREYVEDTTALNFRDMESDVFEAYFSTKKKAYEDRKEAERLAEEKRLAEAKAEAERIEAQRIENERLKKEAEIREAQIKAEREKAEAERKEFEEKAKAERLRVEAELKAKQDAEMVAEKQRLAEEAKQKAEADKLAKAPVKQQLFVWLQTFQKPNEKPSHEVATEIDAKFEAFKKWALTQIENI
jgi:colicin import membrane protein